VVAWFASSCGCVNRSWIVLGAVGDMECARTNCLIYETMSSEREGQEQKKPHPTKPVEGFGSPRDVLRMWRLDVVAQIHVKIDLGMVLTIVSVTFHMLVDLCAQWHHLTQFELRGGMGPGCCHLDLFRGRKGVDETEQLYVCL
jgi:hypothetical protein